MSDLQQSMVFFDDGRDDRSKENFQGFLFKNIDQRARKSPISFQRSDFRGTSIRESHFVLNNFGNADFIDSTIQKTSFQECIFKHSEVYNTYFNEINLTKDLFTSASFTRVIFQKCNITETQFNINTLKECRFIDCKIVNSKFDRCSIDDIEFTDTHLENCDLSGNTAINIFFNNCNFTNVVIDGDYIGSYFFKGGFLDKLQMKYRGKIVAIDLSTIEIFENLSKILFERFRYYESLNVLVQVGIINKAPQSIYRICEMILTRLFKEKNNLKRQYQLEKIFKIFEFYLNTSSILIDDYFAFIAYFEKLNTQSFDLEEQLFLIEKTSRLKSLLNKVDFSDAFIESGRPNHNIFLEVKIDKEDKGTFLPLFDAIAHGICNKLNIREEPYEIVGYRKGSLLIDIVISAPVVIGMMKLLRQILNESRELVRVGSALIADIRLEFYLHSSLTNAKALKSYAGMNKTVRQIQKSDSKSLNASQIDKNAKALLPLLKSFVVYPNALGNSEK